MNNSYFPGTRQIRICNILAQFAIIRQIFCISLIIVLSNIQGDVTYC